MIEFCYISFEWSSLIVARYVYDVVVSSNNREPINAGWQQSAQEAAACCGGMRVCSMARWS